MSKLRLQFEKLGTARYISHLDLMRTFQRLFLRAGILLKHSQGFHPHPLISIILPLPVGQSSQCELLNFEIEGEVDLERMTEQLNSGCPQGVRILRVYEAVRPPKDLIFIKVQIRLLYDDGVPQHGVESLRRLFARPQLMIPKRTKRKEMTEINVSPMIHTLALTEGDGVIEGETIVTAQNPGLNPALLAVAIERELPRLSPRFLTVHRLQMLDASLHEFL